MGSALLDTMAIDTIRTETVEVARRYKTSWIQLGQYLFTIHKDKLFKNWGYLAFETYCIKELGMKKVTASKLLKSYSFLEQEEPRLVDQEDASEGGSPGSLPNFESVNLLRLAKDNQKLTPQDYAEVRESVLEMGREPKEIRAQVKQLLSDRELKDPADVRRERRNTAIRRVISVIGSAKKELENDNLLPEYLIKQMNELVNKLHDQIEN